MWDSHSLFEKVMTGFVTQKCREHIFLKTDSVGATFPTQRIGGVYFVFLRQEGFRQPPRKHFVIHGKFMGNRFMEIHGTSNGKTMEKPWKTQWKIHWKSMGNPWMTKTEKKEMFPWYSMGPHGSPWGPMGTHEELWVPMGSHGDPWGPMGTHGYPYRSPWEPMGSHGSP